ncbi:MAG TPA: hypothetical protein VI981_04610 [Candidatus Paceibacterota bacterium]
MKNYLPSVSVQLGNIETGLIALKKQGWEAIVRPSGVIHLRRPGGIHYCRCPLTALCASQLNIFIPFKMVHNAVQLLGLHHQTASIVVNSSDNQNGEETFDPNFRKKILVIFGLLKVA